MCYLIVLDDGTPFKGSFVAMYQSLKLNYEILAKRNHKGLSVEHFHRFLNKSVTIVVENRGTIDIFVPAGIATGYAWNSAPIDGIYIYSSQYSSYWSGTSLYPQYQSQCFAKTDAKQWSGCIKLFETHRFFSSFIHFYLKNSY